MKNDDTWEPEPYEPPMSVRQVADDARPDAGMFDITEVLGKIDKALDSREMGLAMQKELAKSVMLDVYNEKMGAGDKVRLLAMINDRVDGKVADKVQHSGNLTLDAIFASLPNTSGLPKQEYIDAALDAGYDVDGPETVMITKKDN